MSDEPGGGVFDSGLRDAPEHLIGKFGQLRRRKDGRIGDAQDAEMVFPVSGKGCLEQLHEISRAMALLVGGCSRAHL
jgi:hypothetical protein